MKLVFLGTGAGMPSKERNVSAVALTLYDERGTMWMFDCGEATQHQMLSTPLKAGKLEKLFVTHLHGDHIFGLPGLLSSRSHQGGDTPLTLYGPVGLRSFLDTAMTVSGTRLNYELTIEEIEREGVLLEVGGFRVEARLLAHRIPCYGYRIIERPQPGRLMMEKLEALGVPRGPHLARLKAGEDVVLADGRSLRSSDYVGTPQPGRVLALLGDTRYCEAAVRLAAGADVLVHEATFGASHAEHASQYGHSTSEEAARVAREAGVRALLLTHLSSRYQGSADRELLDEARRIFPETYVAHDFDEFEVPRRTK